jgi:putative zinc finger protein
MSDCVSAEMRDVLPDFVHGQLDAGRTAEVRAHLADCVDCTAEVELLRAVMTAAAAAPNMNVDRIARALPTPTRQGFLLHRGGGTGSPLTPLVSPVMQHRSRLWSRPVVKIAAAVAIVAAGGLSLLVGRDVLRPDTQVGQMAPTPSVPLESAPLASAPDLPVVGSPAPRAPERQVAVATTAGISLAGELQELSDEHLETLIAEMDGMDELPAAEPDQLEPAVGNDAGGGAQ